MDWLSQTQYGLELRLLAVEPDYAPSIQGLFLEMKGVCNAEDKLKTKGAQKAEGRVECQVQMVDVRECKVQVVDMRELENQGVDVRKS